MNYVSLSFCLKAFFTLPLCTKEQRRDHEQDRCREERKCMSMCVLARREKKKDKKKNCVELTHRQQDRRTVKKEKICLLSLLSTQIMCNTTYTYLTLCVCAYYLHPAWSYISYNQIAYRSRVQAPSIDPACATWSWNSFFSVWRHKVKTLPTLCWWLYSPQEKTQESFV